MMTTHIFTPTHYYNTIGWHEPVLEIDPGDRVITTTLDAAGRDDHGDEVTSPGNPQTGPFYVRGAEPGDTLVFHIERVTPNRPYGWSALSLAEHVVDPWTVRDLYQPMPGQPSERASWALDLQNWTASLVTPETMLGRFTLPLDPMLGCFGVAPANRQAISTATSGPYGGNMDYRGFRAGATVYLPVSAPGALLFLGDGHAVQGDGEIAGTGVEVSMEVQFSVDLVKGGAPQWPRGEDEDYIFTAGNARPLDQAVQHATSEMVRWVKERAGLDTLAAGLLIGQTVQYDVGNIFDPAYTMVCKLRKELFER